MSKLLSLVIIFAYLVLGLSSHQGHASLEDGKWIFHFKNARHSFPVHIATQGIPIVDLGMLLDHFKIQKTFNIDRFEVEMLYAPSKRAALLRTDSTLVESNFGSVHLYRRPEFHGLRLMVPIDFGDKVLRPLLGESPQPAPHRLPQAPVDVVLDPGHGGNDLGAQVSGPSKTVIYEKDLNLSTALELKKLLESKGLRVALTRESDRFLMLPERVSIANQLQARLFISIHYNSSARTEQGGHELYLLSLAPEHASTASAIYKEHQPIPTDLADGPEAALIDLNAKSHFENSLGWAKILSRALSTALTPASNPVRAGPFYVLYGTEMPAVLLEFAYMSNPKEFARITSPGERLKFLTPLSQSIAKTIAQSLKK